MKLHYLYPPPSPSPGWMWNGAIWNLCDDTKIEISFLDNMLTLFSVNFFILDSFIVLFFQFSLFGWTGDEFVSIIGFVFKTFFF
jgi:hypothetical protein